MKRPGRSLLVGLLLAPVLLLAAGVSCAQVSKKSMRPTDLLNSPQNYLGREVEIEIVEPLYGPATPAALAALEYSQYTILIPDSFGPEIALVPAAFQLKDPNRYKKKFDRVLAVPLRVRGEFLNDEEMTQAKHQPAYVIRVSSAESLAVGPAENLSSLAELRADPGRWDRKRIVYQGVYESGFEVSSLDKDIWLSTNKQTEVVGKPASVASGRQSNRVRVTGTLFSKPGAHYGHLGGYRFQIEATKLEYL